MRLILSVGASVRVCLGVGASVRVILSVKTSVGVCLCVGVLCEGDSECRVECVSECSALCTQQTYPASLLFPQISASLAPSTL